MVVTDASWREYNAPRVDAAARRGDRLLGGQASRTVQELQELGPLAEGAGGNLADERGSITVALASAAVELEPDQLGGGGRVGDLDPARRGGRLADRAAVGASWTSSATAARPARWSGSPLAAAVGSFHASVQA